MSDITIQNGHEEIARDGFGPSELVQALRITNETLEADMSSLRERIERLKTDHQEQLDRLSTLARLRDTQRQISEKSLNATRRHAMRQAETIGEVDQADENDAFYLRTVERAFQIGRVLGYTGECYRLADALGHMDIWDRVTANDEFAISDEVERYYKVLYIVREAEGYPDGNRHPMSAEYTSLWRRAFRVAKEEGLCDEYQRVSGFLGIPTEFEMRWSGTVRVFVEGWFDVEVDGDAQYGTPDAHDEASAIDLRDYVNDLDYTAEWQELTYED